MIARVFLLVGLLTLAPDVMAWGKFGHLTICEIAYRQLTPDARTELNHLLTDARFS